MSDDSLRLDKWLWFARFAKTRGNAQKLIERGQVVVNGAVVRKASTMLQCGDVVALVLGATRHKLAVRALGTRRGPAEEAQELYERIAAPERLGIDDAALPLHFRPRVATRA